MEREKSFSFQTVVLWGCPILGTAGDDSILFRLLVSLLFPGFHQSCSPFVLPFLLLVSRYLLHVIPCASLRQRCGSGLRKALGAGLRGVLKTEKYKDHQLWVFSGCQDDETSADAHVEGIYQGAFTWALIKALKEDRFKESYRKLLIQLKSNLELGQYKQVPALSTTHDLYLDYGFCGKLQADGCVIEG